MDVMVVEGQEVVRRGVLDMLRERSLVVRTTGVPSVAVALALLHVDPQYDVVVVGSENGAPVGYEDVDAVRRSVPVLLLVPGSSSSELAAAATVRADGYVVSSELSADQLFDVLDRVTRGDVAIPRPLRDYLIAREAPVAWLLGRLTSRESDVLGLMLKGLNNGQIAVELGVTAHAIKRHVSGVLAKLDCPNRATAIATALNSGWSPTGAKAPFRRLSSAGD